MPRYFVKVCDPDGHRERDELFGDWATLGDASEWAQKNVPSHITWYAHHLKYAYQFDRAEWDARLPDFLSTIPHKRGSF